MCQELVLWKHDQIRRALRSSFLERSTTFRNFDLSSRQTNSESLLWIAHYSSLWCLLIFQWRWSRHSLWSLGYDFQQKWSVDLKILGIAQKAFLSWSNLPFVNFAKTNRKERLKYLHLIPLEAPRKANIFRKKEQNRESLSSSLNLKLNFERFSSNHSCSDKCFR